MIRFTYLIATIVLIYVSLLRFCQSESEDDTDYIDLSPQVIPPAEGTQELQLLLTDDKWLVGTLQDVAYYLRNHKFNEWDRRQYKEKPGENQTGFYAAFPDPGLKTIHWKIYENCYADFYKCIKYIHSVIETAPFTRNDDITIMLNKKIEINETATEELNNNCKKALLYSEKTGLPFDGPLEKFQWRTSASYYMCWYTMLGIPALSLLGESCDNFANCLDPEFGIRNHDPRADDKVSFACARYSFCPDPCCPAKHIDSYSECFKSKDNPCFIENAGVDLKRLQCLFNRLDNENFEQIISNKWNVSCNCKEKGFEWKSQFGMCADINECTNKKHNCHRSSENCLNLPGTYTCICKFGYIYDSIKKKCFKKNIFVYPEQKKNEANLTFVDNLKYLLSYIGF